MVLSLLVLNVKVKRGSVFWNDGEPDANVSVHRQLVDLVRATRLRIPNVFALPWLFPQFHQRGVSQPRFLELLQLRRQPDPVRALRFSDLGYCVIKPLGCPKWEAVSLIGTRRIGWLLNTPRHNCPELQ